MPKLRLSPALALVLLAPLTGEVLLGSTPVSRLYLYPSLAAFYGSGALLIRELVYRRSWGWWRVVVLGIGYALIEEGLADQSLFNPHWPGAGAFLVDGRWLGVNWYWAEYLIGWHAIWSISLPILLTSLLFPTRRATSWLRPGGLRPVAIIYGAACVSTFVIYLVLSHGFLAPPLTLACLVLLLFVVVGLALGIPPRVSLFLQAQPTQPSSGLSLLLFLIAFLSGLFWLVNHDYLPPLVAPLPLIVAQLALAVLVSLLILLIRHWAWTRSQWGEHQLLALAAGALLGGVLAGLKIVQDGLPVDLIAQGVLCVMTIVFLVVIYGRIAHRQSSSTTTPPEVAENFPVRSPQRTHDT